ncbi:restriction system-associated AAA family ATPase [Halomicronema sp. CCY15110]|uniref:restriction system-associated AAA family ATPase n=1 Tax=Halomicronema sp. CCY15110 TaxID=2767773 RepID=UPI00194F03C5|nr:restriction system-associated AAA family ATPase [Halomicronema sp. CCY15110]
MKLLRLKITAHQGFRSLQAGFEHYFRTEWALQDERGFAPFILAGRNGSGKSNLLEALAAIFYHLECIYLEDKPDSFIYEAQANPNGFRSEQASPDGFEIEYLMPPPPDLDREDDQVRIRIIKQPEQAPAWTLWNTRQEAWEELKAGRKLRYTLLPEYVLGYSSGENEILSLPFFKMRFIQFDEYWRALTQDLSYSDRPESRLVYLDSGFSQAILLCNLLLQEAAALSPFQEDIGIEALREFRIVIQLSFELDIDQIWAFGSQSASQQQSVEDIVRNHPALDSVDDGVGGYRYRVNVVQLLDGDDFDSDDSDGDDSNDNESLKERADKLKIIPRLKRCATCWFVDAATDTLYLDYYVNDATRQAFRENFDFAINGSPISLFQAFQVLLTLNLYSVSDQLKADLYQSDSLYVSESVPTLAADERIIRFKNVWLTKTDVAEPVLLKSFSDGEHQLLHTLGLCLLFKNTHSLFLLDEPETHFNPDWRANFVTRLYDSFGDADRQEMLITTHTPFVISDSKPEKVLVFDKTNGIVSVNHPDYNTFGASINKITMNTFSKRETIGRRAQDELGQFRERSTRPNEDKEQLITEINQQLGDSVEKMLLIKTILDRMEAQD